MSFKVDFNELPYDLLTILELSENCTTKEVKTAYKKAVLKYHPDKNRNADEEFFSWISLAHKVLINPEHREIYIEWRKSTDEHTKLKTDYKNNKIQVNTTKTYKELEEELNNKHGYNATEQTPLDPNIFSKKINDLKNTRTNLIIPKENISDINIAFKELKNNTNKMKERNQNIIQYTGELTTLPSTSNFGSLDNYGKLYGENEKLITNKITSFNDAFNLSPYQEYVPDNLSLEEKIKQYENETQNLKKLQKK